MTNDKIFRISFVIISLAFLWSLLRVEIYKNDHDKLIKKIETTNSTLDSIQFINDSLSSEIFPCEIELGRYQVAFQIFMERNPKAASQYGDIISNETE